MQFSLFACSFQNPAVQPPEVSIFPLSIPGSVEIRKRSYYSTIPVVCE
jgi:hypothetical protein